MKATLFSTLPIIISMLCSPHSIAQDYTRWNLPEGLKYASVKGQYMMFSFSRMVLGLQSPAASGFGYMMHGPIKKSLCSQDTRTRSGALHSVRGAKHLPVEVWMALSAYGLSPHGNTNKSLRRIQSRA